MNFLVAVMFVVVSHSAFGAGDVDSLLKRVDDKINRIELEQGKTPAPFQNVLDKKEAALWSSIVGAYDYLKSYSITARYFFMYEAMRATSLGHPQRVPALKEWLTKENQKMQVLGISPQFYVQWNKHIININKSIIEISAPRSAQTNVGTASEYEFLREIKYDLEAIRVTEKSAIAVSSAPVEIKKIELSTPLSDKQETVYLALLGICVAIIGFSLKSSPPKAQPRKIIKRTALVKTETDVAPMTANIPPLPSEAVTFHGVSMEEKCREVIIANSHIFSAAELNVLPSQRCSFRTTVNATATNLNEALNWLVKGTMAIANTSGSKASHMEWNCKENAGRIYLELVLHGIECNEKNLYMNILMDGNGSGPAHFGRTEMALEGHFPSVSFKSGNNKTTVCLGLDALTQEMNH